MANLSIYLFWTGMATSLMASALYIAYVASASLAVRRMTAQTSAGTVTIAQPSGVPNAGIGRLATVFTAFTVIFLAGQVAARWSATGHAVLLTDGGQSANHRDRPGPEALRLGHHRVGGQPARFRGRRYRYAACHR